MTRCARIAALAAVIVPGALFAQAPSSIRGTIRNETGRPIELALVTLDPSGPNRQVRTDRDGRFTFLGVPPGEHTVRVMFVGFRSAERMLTLDAPVDIDIVLERVTPTLAEVQVTARRKGLYGSVVTRDTFDPLPGATVVVLGARVSDTTTTEGTFNFPDIKPGSYLVRVTNPGFDSRLESIVVPRDGGTSLDLVMQRGLSRDAHMQMLYEELGERVWWKGASAAFISREEMKGGGKTGLDVAMVTSPGFMKANFYPMREGWEGACLFVDGVPRPGAKISDFALDEIEAIEIYGPPMNRSEPTKSLEQRWPPRQPCGSSEGPNPNWSRGGQANTSPARLSSSAVRIQFAAIWLRRN